MLAKQTLQRLQRRAILWAAGCVAACTSAAVVTAQETAPVNPANGKPFAEIKQLPDPKGGGGVINLEKYDPRKVQTILLRIRNDGRFSVPDDDQVFDLYYKFRVAELTWLSSLESLPKKRDQFKKDLRQTFNNASGVLEVHAKMNALLLQILPALISNENYHPASRVNMALILGDLNEKEVQIGAAAVPLPAALPPLVLRLAEKSLPDEVRVAILVGVKRQLEFPSKDVKIDDLRKAIDALRGIVNLQADAKVKSRPGIAWLRRQACLALGVLAFSKVEDFQNEVQQAAVITDVHELVRDKAADMNERCIAAYTLGLFRSRNYPKNFVRTAAQSLGDLALAISNVGSDRQLSASELAFMLNCVLTGLDGADQNRGIAPLADIEKDAQDLVKSLRDQIKKAVDKINAAPNMSQEDLTDVINAMRLELQKIVQPGGGTAVPPAASTPAKGSTAPATAGPRVGAPSRPAGTVGMKE